MNRLLDDLRQELIQISRFIAQGLNDIQHIEANKRLNEILNELSELALRTEEVSKTYTTGFGNILTPEQVRKELGDKYEEEKIEDKKKDKKKDKKENLPSVVPSTIKMRQTLASKRDVLHETTRNILKSNKIKKMVFPFLVDVRQKLNSILDSLQKLSLIKNNQVTDFVDEIIEQVFDLATNLDGAIKWSAPKEKEPKDIIEIGDTDVEPITSNKKIESLIALADSLDSAGQEEEANKIDEMIKKMAVELPPIDPKKVSFDETEEEKEQAKLYAEHQAKQGIMKLLADAQKLILSWPIENLYKYSWFNDAMESLEKFVEYAPADLSNKNKLGEATPEAFEKLAIIADKLDEIGAKEEANLIDEFLSKNAAKKEIDPYDSKSHHSMQIREPKEVKEVKEHSVKPYNKTPPTLSIRHCPEHIGVPLARIGENIYQCALDGAVFNWETGFTANDVEYPGSSVAAQTPQSSEYGIPSRIFDSREKILNVIN